jgi:hypothetical protein
MKSRKESKESKNGAILSQSNRPCSLFTDVLAWTLSTTVSIVKYPFEHPYTLFFLSCVAGAEIFRNLTKNESSAIKYPEQLYSAYPGPSILYIPAQIFDPSRELEGWVTDIQGCFREKGSRSRSCRHADPSIKTEEMIQMMMTSPYLKSLYYPPTNYKSRQGVNINGFGQTTFGFYGYSRIEEFPGEEKEGFFIGIHAFGNKGYYSGYNSLNNTFQLAKINLDDLAAEIQNQHGDYSRFYNRIAHVYVKKGKVQYHPDAETFEKEFCDYWSPACFQKFINSLPHFASTVSWVISASDLHHVLKGDSVKNLLTNETINILKWEKRQRKKAERKDVSLGEFSIFSLERPRGYLSSYDAQAKLKAPFLIKIGRR